MIVLNLLQMNTDKIAKHSKIRLINIIFLKKHNPIAIESKNLLRVE